MSAACRDWAQIVGLLLLMLAMFFATNCARAPVRQLPPPEFWPICAALCESQGAPYLGIILPTPDGKPFGCGCGTRSAPAPQPQAWR